MIDQSKLDELKRLFTDFEIAMCAVDHCWRSCKPDDYRESIMNDRDERYQKLQSDLIAEVERMREDYKDLADFCKAETNNLKEERDQLTAISAAKQRCIDSLLSENERLRSLGSWSR